MVVLQIIGMFVLFLKAPEVSCINSNAPYPRSAVFATS